MALIVLLAIPFAASLAVALLPTHARTTAAACAAIVALAGLAQVMLLFSNVDAGGVIRVSRPKQAA